MNCYSFENAEILFGNTEETLNFYKNGFVSWMIKLVEQLDNLLGGDLRSNFFSSLALQVTSMFGQSRIG
jgi:hypothetical protein